jgi:alkyl sulfatase BDS1-like metallo-beta-lactamase superfamily hydrolase
MIKKASPDLALPEDLRFPKAATEHTQKTQVEYLRLLPFDDRTDFENAARGLIAEAPSLKIVRDEDEKIVYDLSRLTFLEGKAPTTVNPGLWRQAQLNALHPGLYEVVDGIYQVRGFDLAHLTLIRGRSGWILIDPLTSSECSRAALELADRHLGPRPVKVVLFTHSHADHFAGIWGVTTPEKVRQGQVLIVAPEGFVQAALSENVLAGNVMRRRAQYMYGHLLPHSPQGFVTIGLGPLLSQGSTGFALPTETIRHTGEKRILDGVEFVFQMTPDTEAVSEFVFFLPQFQALGMSEITTHHLHNIYTPRGAQIRDALAWAEGIQQSLSLFGDQVEVQFGSHHWPIWGREKVIAFLERQRDLYKYIHDQTLRLANQGYTLEEIAEQLRLPRSLAGDFAHRDYYGTVSQNAKAVYVKYLGFFDGNPARLHPLPRRDAALRYVEYMGGPEAVLEKARQSFEKGEYRWTAEVLDHLVQADPQNIKARALLADTFEQLGYQAESGAWRNFYLSGAWELRHGRPQASPARISRGMLEGLPLENLFQALSVRLNGPKAEGKDLRFQCTFPDLKKTYSLTVRNSVLHAFPDREDPTAPARLTLSGSDFKSLMAGLVTAAELIASGKMIAEGDLTVLMEFAGLLDDFDPFFPLVGPRV